LKSRSYKMANTDKNKETDWQADNQRYLMDCLAEVRALLDRNISTSGSSNQITALNEGMPDTPGKVWAHDQPPAIDSLCAQLKLSPFERHLLLLTLGAELDSSFTSLYARAHNQPDGAYPAFSLGFAAFPASHWSAISPQGPLRYWRLIEIGPGRTLLNSPLKVDERVLHYLTGIKCTDERLFGLIQINKEVEEPTESHQPIVLNILQRLVGVTDASQISFQITGNDSAGQRTVAQSICQTLGVRLVELNWKYLPTAGPEFDILVRLCEREAALTRSFYLLDCSHSNSIDELLPLIRFAETLQTAVIITTRDAFKIERRHFDRIIVNKPDVAERKSIWRQVLGDATETLNGHIDSVSTQFAMTSSEIRSAAQEYQRLIKAGNLSDAGKVLWDACRHQCSYRLDELAQRVQPVARWKDLVLPESHILTLRQLVAHVRQRARVYDDWGFGNMSQRGLGISALFTGSSGTGKTMSAEVVANELNLDLYRIDLSSLVSKYIGETEKNLRRVFDAAEDGGSILLFDEADALFGKRSEVKDSHDRYANIETSYLLQRIETYRGLVILTSNFKQSIDSAFLRRLRFIVHFPFPDFKQRTEIWQRVFPSTLPTDNLVWEKLAKLSLPGGAIRNLALNAAFLAADEEQPVTMSHLLAAAQSEYDKLEKSLSQSEISDWIV
jgi:hypothetical protein